MNSKKIGKLEKDMLVMSIAYIVRDIVDNNYKINKSCKDCKDADWVEWNKSKKTKRGCCVWCAKSEGYFSDRDNSKFIDYVKKKFGFNKVDGFFDTKTKKCKLPTMFKSYTCNVYACPEALKGIDVSKNPCLAFDEIRTYILHRYGLKKFLEIAKLAKRHV